MKSQHDRPLVILIDDEAAVRESLGEVLARQGYAVRTFAAASDYLAVHETLRADCVVADVRMPGLDGMAMYRRSRAAGQDVATVFITGYADVPAVVAAMRAGACDVLEKPVRISALLAAIEAAIAHSSARREADAVLAAQWRTMATLTAREAEVGALVARGLSNKQIAVAIGTTEKTVKVHRARALRKLDVHSAAELAHLVDAVLAAGRHRQSVEENGHQLRRPALLDRLERLPGPPSPPLALGPIPLAAQVSHHVTDAKRRGNADRPG